MSAILETLVALFIYGIPLFSMVIFLVTGIRDYGKPRRRSTYRTPRRTYKRKFNAGIRRREFRYADNELTDYQTTAIAMLLTDRATITSHTLLGSFGFFTFI